jgi:HlyD family secretion protein
MKSWLQSGELKRLKSVDIERFSNLGELQPQFQSFEQAYREFVTYLPGGFYSQEREILKEELEYTRQLHEKLKEQKAIQEVSLDLAQKEYEMQKKLSERDLLAPIELEKAKSNVAASRLPLKQTESSIINNRVSQTAKKKELMELKKQAEQQQSVFLQALNIMKSAIDEWKSNYLIVSPIKGQLVYAGIIQEKQILQSGQTIGYVQPANTQFFGQMKVSQRSFGKIEEGQNVLVRFSGYPDHEFGSVTGEIDYFSEFPVRDSVFMAKVNFPNEFTTNYGQEITPVDGMRGQAEIITQDMRFVERIYNNLTKELR